MSTVRQLSAFYLWVTITSNLIGILSLLSCESVITIIKPPKVTLNPVLGCCYIKKLFTAHSSRLLSELLANLLNEINNNCQLMRVIIYLLQQIIIYYKITYRLQKIIMNQRGLTLGFQGTIFYLYYLSYQSVQKYVISKVCATENLTLASSIQVLRGQKHRVLIS